MKLHMPPEGAKAQSFTPYTAQPLIGRATPEQLAAERISSLRHTLQPNILDFLPTVSNPDLRPSLIRVGEDQPAPASASIVTSDEQTVDLTLAADAAVTGTPLNSASGLPVIATPWYTDVTWSHINDFIVFAAVIPGTTNYHLFAMYANGSAIGTIAGVASPIVQLTFGNGNERYPTLEGPNDNTIVYCSDNNATTPLELVSAPVSINNSALSIGSQVPLNNAYEARHPFYFGQSIYFSGRPVGSTGPFDIYDLTENNITELTGGGADNDDPVVTAAGSGYIAWDSNSTGFTYSTTSNLPYVLSATGTSTNNVRNIFVATTSGANPFGTSDYSFTTGSSNGLYNNDHPQWTTDTTNAFVGDQAQRYLFFDSNRQDFFGQQANNGRYHLYYFSGIQANLPVHEANAVDQPTTQVNTSDPSGFAGGYTPAGDNNQFNDVQPALSQLNNAYISVAYISNRYLLDHNFDNQLQVSSLHDTGSVATANSGVTLGIATNLSQALLAGTSTLPVGSIDGAGGNTTFFPGQTIIIDQGTATSETAVVSSVGTSPPSLTLTAPTAFDHIKGASVIVMSTTTTATTTFGATQLPVTSVEGFVVGQTVEIDRGQGGGDGNQGIDEFAVIQAIDTSNKILTVTFLSQTHVAGASVFPTVDKEPASIPTFPSHQFPAASEIMISRLVDVNPPSLVRFSNATNEIVHVFSGPLYNQDGSTNYNPAATPTHFVPAGQDATFIVRLSDRQTGIGQAWLQIKDPNSFTQDATGLEHKVFTQESVDGFGRTNVSQFASDLQFHPDYNESTSLFNLTNSGLGLADGDGVYVGHSLQGPGTRVMEPLI
jgi:hypothetical protein